MGRTKRQTAQKPIWKWAAGSRSKINAQVAGEEFERIRGVYRHLTPAAVVDSARPADAPLHDAIEWDDHTAAEAHREDQARYILRSIRIVVPKRDDPHIAYVHVKINDNEEVKSVYMPVVEVMSDDDLAAQVIRECVVLIDGMKKRMDHLLVLKQFFRGIEPHVTKLKRKIGKRHRRPKAS